MQDTQRQVLLASVEVGFVYVCNCNGIREREVRAAIAAGAKRPVEVFRARGCAPRCGRCVCEMREMIEAEPTATQEALRFAAE